ncbi:MAG: haloalkane dehalogenase [Pseudomonadota bacterium]
MEKKFIDVLGRRMAFVETGAGRPIVFQHGNPTSSYLWRNILPHLSDLGRCIAVDLIGMGDSDKLPGDDPLRYSFSEHSKYLDAAWDALGLTEDVTLVLHDWGSALGFDWVFRNPERVRAIAYMEAVVAPVRSWDDFPDNARNIFQAMRSEAGEELVLQKNVFIELVLPAATLSGIDEADMDEYRRPFHSPGEDRRPTLTWPRQIPIEGEPADVATRVAAYSAWMGETEIPKLFINADPGSLLGDTARTLVRRWKNQTEVTAPGAHFIQEDSPEQITAALREFLIALD